MSIIFSKIREAHRSEHLLESLVKMVDISGRGDCILFLCKRKSVSLMLDAETSVEAIGNV